MSALLRFAAIFELATGLFCLILPRTLIHLLIGGDVSGATPVVTRVAGIALVALGTACWPSSGAPAASTRGLGGMTTYSLLVTAYFVLLGVERQWVGVLLWPVVAFHGVMTFLLARQWLRLRRSPPGA